MRHLRPLLLCLALTPAVHAMDRAERVRQVTALPGLVAFWDFVQREDGTSARFSAYGPAGATGRYPLEAVNYVRDYWGRGRAATYADFPLLGRGPFGNALRIRPETDPDFRPLLMVPRTALHDTPLDLKGSGQGLSVVVWAIRESGNHALAGIWHEGTDLRQPETEGIQRIERGRRQYALFAGLNHAGSACGHVSENGASSFLNRYALHKCNSAAVAPAVPVDGPAEKVDRSWHCFAMTFDPSRQELTGWLDGEAGDRWLDQPGRDRLISSAHQAYLQAHWARQPGLQPGERPDFPADQHYLPPEKEPAAVVVERASATERVEVHTYRFTRVRKIFRLSATKEWHESERDLVGLRLNPWWYPHGIYTPPDAASGGPFTIGRVIHSSRGVGFTGWIGGVAVFDRALTTAELRALSVLSRMTPIASGN